MLQSWCQQGLIPFSEPETDLFFTQYIANDYPPIHHSRIYHDTYHPAYRLIRTDFAKYFPIFVTIDKLLKTKSHVVIAIDGKCGGGKSTLSDILSEVYVTNIIHMDDFYLPANLRTKERLNTPGGNIHYERFASQVLSALLELKQSKCDNHPFTNHDYQIFDCHKMDYKEQLATIADRPLTIVEGSYSLRPEFRDAYDLKIFLDISPEIQQERLLARNGVEAYKNFESKWIPMELKYFEYYNIVNCCDLIFYCNAIK